MNARIDMYSPDEVAKSVGVTGATIRNWCRDGIINCNNVSDGSVDARYEIPEDELRYLRGLAREYGSKKVLLYYNKNWRDSDMNTNELDPNKEYSSIEASNILGVDHDGFNTHCRKGHFNCRVDKTNRKKYFRYFLPGWEVIYLKALYDKFGRNSGNGAALRHYVKDRDKRDEDLCMPMAPVNAIKEHTVEACTPNDIVENQVLATASGYVDKEPSDDKLLDDLIKLRDLKRDIEKYDTLLNQMRNEYNQLKEELIEWL